MSIRNTSRKARNALFSALLITASTLTFAMAQESPGQMSNRLERMERDIILLQKQLYRGQGGQNYRATDYGSDPNSIDSGETAVAKSGVQMSEVDEKMRRVNGKIEELQHAVTRINDRLDKLQQDMDYRFQDLSSGKQQLGSSQSMNGERPTNTIDAVAQENMKQAMQSEQKMGSLKEKPAPSEDSDLTTNFDSSEEHYNYAFRLLNKARFDEAKQSLEQFIQEYPEDPLIGNAYYWLGEVHYVNRDYPDAADNFRQGFEKMPKGPKAPDNLLKLGMSLSAQSKKDEACVVYKELMTKYPNVSSAVKQNAESENRRAGCDPVKGKAKNKG